MSTSETPRTDRELVWTHEGCHTGYVHGDFARRLERELNELSARPQSAPEWRTIESAPKDELILLYLPHAFEWGKATPGKWNSDQYAKKPRPYWEVWLKIGGIQEWRSWEPTHWMPLPAAPQGGRK